MLVSLGLDQHIEDLALGVEERQARDGEETADTVVPASRGGGPDLGISASKRRLFASPFLLVDPAPPRMHRR
jgi:hypothetical protein